MNQERVLKGPQTAVDGVRAEELDKVVETIVGLLDVIAGSLDMIAMYYRRKGEAEKLYQAGDVPEDEDIAPLDEGKTK